MKTIRLFFGLFLIVGCIYAAWKIVPVYFTNYQFEETMDDAARMASENRKSVDEIRATVFDKAQSYDIPVRAEDIQVSRGGYEGDEISISADYRVHIDMPLYPFDLRFHPSTKREGLRFH